MTHSTDTGYSRPGSTACHCHSCGETFTGLTAFDTHRVNRQHGDAQCAHPGDVGLILRTRKGGTIWGSPGENPTYETE